MMEMKGNRGGNEKQRGKGKERRDREGWKKRLQKGNRTEIEKDKNYVNQELRAQEGGKKKRGEGEQDDEAGRTTA